MYTPHIRIQDLNVVYEGRHVLHDISVEIPEGKITAIIGPSGCGKTTLLKTMSRLIDLTDGVRVSGRVLLNGVDVLDPGVDVTDMRKKMGFISQLPNPLPMSIYDNVAYGPKVHGLREKMELDRKVEHCLRSAGLWDEVDKRLSDPASKLSAGQQQRLCLARALAVEPEVLLCDEPTSALDPKSSQHIEEQLRKIKQDYTVVFVTHILRQARRIADYVLFIYLGELVEFGPVESVLDEPKDPKTREYIKGVFG